MYITGSVLSSFYRFKLQEQNFLNPLTMRAKKVEYLIWWVILKKKMLFCLRKKNDEIGISILGIWANVYNCATFVFY